MRNIKINIYETEVWKEARKATNYAADKSAPVGDDKEGVYDKVLMTAAAAEDLHPYYNEAIAVLQSRLGNRCSNVMVCGDYVEVALNVSERYQDALTSQVQSLLQGFCTDYICGLWYSDISGDKSKAAMAQAAAKLEAAISTLNNLSAPQHE